MRHLEFPDGKFMLIPETVEEVGILKNLADAFADVCEIALSFELTCIKENENYPVLFFEDITERERSNE